MIIYYVVTLNGNKGSFVRNKVEKMHPGLEVFECDISYYQGHLYSSEWL
jgi:hypothetical protein